MTATIRIGPLTATIKGYQWTSETDGFADMLNAMLDPSGPSGADPNPDLTAATEAARNLGGEIVSFDPTDYKEGRVY